MQYKKFVLMGVALIDINMNGLHFDEVGRFFSWNGNTEVFEVALTSEFI